MSGAEYDDAVVFRLGERATDEEIGRRVVKRVDHPGSALSHVVGIRTALEPAVREPNHDASVAPRRDPGRNTAKDAVITARARHSTGAAQVP